MSNTLQLENIEEMRRREGIDDPELREEIRSLIPGDVVRITFLTGGTSFETVPVRVTAIRGGRYCGELAARPPRGSAAELVVGTAVTFTAAHIHSVSRSAPPPHG